MRLVAPAFRFGHMVAWSSRLWAWEQRCWTCRGDRPAARARPGGVGHRRYGAKRRPFLNTPTGVRYLAGTGTSAPPWVYQPWPSEEGADERASAVRWDGGSALARRRHPGGRQGNDRRGADQRAGTGGGGPAHLRSGNGGDVGVRDR